MRPPSHHQNSFLCCSYIVGHARPPREGPRQVARIHAFVREALLLPHAPAQCDAALLRVGGRLPSWQGPWPHAACCTHPTHPHSCSFTPTLAHTRRLLAQGARLCQHWRRLPRGDGHERVPLLCRAHIGAAAAPHRRVALRGPALGDGPRCQHPHASPPLSSPLAQPLRPSAPSLVAAAHPLRRFNGSGPGGAVLGGKWRRQPQRRW